MGKARIKTQETELSAIQKAAVQKLEILIRECAFVRLPSFLYNQKDILKKIETDLSRLDEEYIMKHNIPDDVVKKMAKGVYNELMKKGEYDRAITMAVHYKL